MGAYTILPSPAFLSDVTHLQRKFHRIGKDLKKFFDRELSIDPRKCGDKIPGVPGAWKARCGIPSANVSKSDGLRLIYLISNTHQGVVLVMIYHKKERADVSRPELRRAVEKALPIFDQSAKQRNIDPAIFKDALTKLLEDS